MKKLILTFGLVFSVAVSTNAQSIEKYGVKGGINLANLKGVNGKNRTGLAIGVFGEYLLSEQFAVRSETVFSVQGAKSKVNEDEIKLSYLNWPILAKIYVVEGLSLEAGPQIGFLLNGKGGILPGSAYKTVELGLAFGAGIELYDGLELNARYNLGLTDITKTPGALKNKGFQFTIGIGL